MTHQSPYYILRPDGIILPVADLLTWARWFEDMKNRRVRLDELDGVSVSTVFLGLDHNFGSEGPPILFETAILTDDDECVIVGRAAQKAEAMEMHEATVANCREWKRYATAGTAQLLAALAVKR